MEYFNHLFDSDPHKVDAYPHGKLLEHSRERITKRPAIYEVILLNDDETPMEFVVNVLETIFHKSPDDAVDLTLQTHNEGRASCGAYTREVGETKMITVIDMARANGFPLKCIMHRK